LTVLGFCGSLIALYLPRLPVLETLTFNWQGKALAVAVAVATVALSRLTWREVGAYGPRPGWRRPFAITLTVLVVAAVLLNVAWPSEHAGLEAALFQATMPGLQEELMFRGVLFASLDRVLQGRRRLWGADVGWSLPTTTALFALIHGVAVVDGQVVLDAGSFAFTTVLGFVLGWVRARGGSVWPSVVLHNTWNLTGAAVAAAL
jgi:membrane protease YdiL (CAAX protease family)